LYLSRPVQWYQLIKEMEEFREQTGWGLAETWGFVHRGDYDAARASFDRVVELQGAKVVAEQ
jgi:hypothetical protein